ncbi:MAG: hypothetical protein ACKN81_09915 [Pirellulaceae bacterium]
MWKPSNVSQRSVCVQWDQRQAVYLKGWFFARFSNTFGSLAT